MGSIHTDNRRASTEQHQHQHRDELDETAPLLLSRNRSTDISIAESTAVQEVPSAGPNSIHNDNESPTEMSPWPSSTKHLIFLCAFLTSLSFGVTQVPLLYVFRLMTCDDYYENHPSEPSSRNTTGSALSYALPLKSYMSGGNFETNFDRCSIRPIESSTALSVSLLGASTTVFGLLNLFLTSSLIKRIGLKSTLLMQVFFPALRLLVQNIGVEVWGSRGIIIIQLSQIVSIVGGPSGYLLVLNSFITEVVEYEGRTAALGRVTGSTMSGAALGFLLGGVVADAFGIKAPFRLTLMLFLTSCAYVAIFLPRVAPSGNKSAQAGMANGAGNKKGIIRKFFGPLGVFFPRKFVGKDGVVRTEYGAFLLAWGVFLGILATGYLPTVLQLYSTDVFGFGTKQNGWLIFMFSMLRGIFLTFAFPKLIAVGRKITSKDKAKLETVEESVIPERRPLLHTATSNPENAPDKKDVPKKEEVYTFDLTYTRFSLVADGLLTLLCSLVRQGWQMYLVAAILPFAAGTGAAAKGTVLQMVGRGASSTERTDALAGISLVENMARLTTTFVFGVVFAAFANIGRTELVFTVNAAVALLGFCILLMARFPPEGSHRLEDQEDS